MTGYGGWSWVSKTRVPRFVPKLPGNTNVNYRQELEGKCQTGQISTMYSPAGTFWFVLISFFLFPADFTAAKMNKENAAACTNKQITSMETEKQTTQPAADEEGERETVSGSAQTTSSQDRSEEGKLKGEQQEMDEEEKNGNEKIEVDPCLENMSSPEKGKCSTLNELTSMFGLCLVLSVSGNVFPPSDEFCDSVL